MSAPVIEDVGPRGFFLAIVVGVLFGLTAASILSVVSFSYMQLSRSTLTRTIETLDAENTRLHEQLTDCRQTVK